MLTDTDQTILDHFLQGKYPQMDCPQCENTFLTNVYSMEDPNREATDQYVLLEKHALGLEYFCHAIKAYDLVKIPTIRRIGVLSADDEPLDTAQIQLFTHEEPDYRIIYVMERLQHLDTADSAFFTEHVHEIDWMAEADRHRIWTWVSERYSPELAEDIRRLCCYYRDHKEFVAWDLHGDNLMRRAHTGEIVVMDPFTPNMGG